MQEKLISILPIRTHNNTKKKKLKERILKKRRQLTLSITKVEMLRVKLDMVKQEYDVRVGNLYLKGNQQDLEIIYYRNILQLMKEGLSYEDAVRKLNETYYGKQRKLEHEKEQIQYEEKIYKKRAESQFNPNDKSLKNLWKYLVGKFHPDLVQDSTEKKRREVIMKQINRAYEEQDYENLKRLENEVHIDTYEESTLGKLEQILVEIENEIIQQAVYLRELRTSDWFAWKVKIENAKKRNTDIFADIERGLLDDIVRKYAILRTLKAQVKS